MFEKFSINSQPDKTRRGLLKGAAALGIGAVASQVPGVVEAGRWQDPALVNRLIEAEKRPYTERIRDSAGMFLSGQLEGQETLCLRGLCGLVEFEGHKYIATARHVLTDCIDNVYVTLPVRGVVKIPVEAFYSLQEENGKFNFVPFDAGTSPPLDSESIVLTPWAMGRDLEDALFTGELVPLKVPSKEQRDAMLNSSNVLVFPRTEGSQPVDVDKDRGFGVHKPELTNTDTTVTMSISDENLPPQIACQGVSGGVVFDQFGQAYGVVKAIEGSVPLGSEHGSSAGILCSRDAVQFIPFP